MFIFDNMSFKYQKVSLFQDFHRYTYFNKTIFSIEKTVCFHSYSIYVNQKYFSNGLEIYQEIIL